MINQGVVARQEVMQAGDLGVKDTWEGANTQKKGAHNDLGLR